MKKGILSSAIWTKVDEEKRQPMGKRKNGYFRVRFNRKLKVGFKGDEITSDGGLVAIANLSGWC